jgi:cell division protein FtsQ
MTATATIRRGAAPKKKRSAAKLRIAHKPSTASRALAVIPVPAEQLRRAGNYLLVGLLGIGLVAGIVAIKLPQMVGLELGEAIGSMGFAVKRVEIKGIDRMDRLPVYSVALDQQSMAMPLVDLAEIRNRLLQFGWVQDARVSRRLPDTLVVDIVERKPTAIWQYNQKLALIDAEGHVLAAVDPAKMPDLPLLIGPDANLQSTALGDLIAAAPAIKPMLTGASWVGGRRWDLRFQSGETLALPEGQDAAKAALIKFARMDANARLLGQGFVRFDMRVPDRFVVRVSKVPGKDLASDTAPKSVT